MTAAFAAACLLGAGGATQALAAPEDKIWPIYVDPVNGSDDNDGKEWRTAMKTISAAVAKTDKDEYYNERRVQVTLAKGTYVLDSVVWLKTRTSLVGDPECDRSEVVLTAPEGKTMSSFLHLAYFPDADFVNTVANLTISNVTMNGEMPIVCGYQQPEGRWSKVVSNVVFTLCRQTNGTGCSAMLVDGRSLITDCVFSCLTNTSTGLASCENGGWFRNCLFENNYNGYITVGDRYLTETNQYVIEGCTFTNNVATGGGTCIKNVPVVRDCLFADNRCELNGSVGEWGDAANGFFTNHPPQVVGCTFLRNYSIAFNMVDRGGGALWFTNGGTVSNCTFVGNLTKGTSICVENAIEVVDCVFDDNVNQSGWGGRRSGTLSFNSNAAYAWRTPRVERCRFTDNRIVQNWSGTGGAALWTQVPLEVEDCVFEGNSAKFGGAVGWAAAGGSISGCTFSGNYAFGAPSDSYPCGGAAIYANVPNETASAALTVRNCLFEGNTLTNTTTRTHGSAAVFVSGGAPAIVESCTVVANSSVGGTPAAIYCATYDNATAVANSGIGQLYVTNTVVALNVGTNGAPAQAISSYDGFSSALAERIGYSYLHPAIATEWGSWTADQHVTDSDVAPEFKSGTWIPSAKSALRDAGLFQAWMTGAFDLQRNADGKAFATRVCNGIPDIGAFERVPTGGFTVIVR